MSQPPRLIQRRFEKPELQPWRGLRKALLWQTAESYRAGARTREQVHNNWSNDER